MVRRVVVLLVVAMLFGLVSPVGAVAGESDGPDDGLVRAEDSSGVQVDLPELPDPWESDLEFGIPPYEPSAEASKLGLPMVATSLVVPSGKSAATFSDFPLSAVVDRGKSTGDVAIDVAGLDEIAAASLSPVGAAFEVNVAAGVEKAAMALDAVKFELDYSDVALTAGADFIGRMRMLQYDGCVTAKEPEGALACDHVRILETINDVKARIVSFSLEAPKVERLVPGAIPIASSSEGVTVVALSSDSQDGWAVGSSGRRERVLGGDDTGRDCLHIWP